jgi:hypothetical protein
MSGFLLALACNYLGWALLGLGLPRHYQQHYGAPPSPARARVLRLAGWATALLGLGLCWHRFDWGQGSVIWAAAWMLAAMGWILLQAWRPALGRWLAPALLLLSIAGCLLG